MFSLSKYILIYNSFMYVSRFQNSVEIFAYPRRQQSGPRTRPYLSAPCSVLLRGPDEDEEEEEEEEDRWGGAAGPRLLWSPFSLPLRPSSSSPPLRAPPPCWS